MASSREHQSVGLTGTRPTEGSDARLSARDVSVTYWSSRGESVLALDKVSVDIPDGQFLCIVGPSGCGKTTFLNVVGGLVPLSSGEIHLDGAPIRAANDQCSIVFQSPSLLPWRTVKKNVTWPLELRKLDKRVQSDRADEFLNLVGLDGFENRYPHELSGGMQQRVNLARALATDPSMLLLDEPFAALDAQTREFMQQELLNIWTESKKTALFITHQIDEAVYLADQVLVFSPRPGRVEAVIEVDLPRPRTLDIKHTPEFQAIVNRIWKLIAPHVALGAK